MHKALPSFVMEAGVDTVTAVAFHNVYGVLPSLNFRRYSFSEAPLKKMGLYAAEVVITFLIKQQLNALAQKINSTKNSPGAK